MIYITARLLATIMAVLRHCRCCRCCYRLWDDTFSGESNVCWRSVIVFACLTEVRGGGWGGNEDSRLCWCLGCQIFVFSNRFWMPVFWAFYVLLSFCIYSLSPPPPQWGAADAEIKVPSDENTELKRCPFKAWSRSVYSHTCSAYCQGFLSFLLISTLPVHSSAFFPKPLPIFSCVGCG